ncbi:unnamed protein product [Rotaria sp. Silwood1]|nr:unnamed protein product [Rotaria sp. Silwood1]
MAITHRTVTLHKRTYQPIFGLYFGDDIPYGVYIITIEPNSPAADAYIQPGDRILAVNGQLISQMFGNPREIVSELANRVQSLTLTLQSTNILRVIDEPFTNGYYNNYYQYSSNYNQGIDYDLESYTKGLFFNENLKIRPVSSWNNDEYILVPDDYVRRPDEYILVCDQYPIRSRHRRRHRKRKHHMRKRTHTSSEDELSEDMQRSSLHRVAPSMDTYEDMSSLSMPPIINNQELHNNQIVNYPQVGFNEHQQGLLDHNQTLSPTVDEGLREVRLYRSSNSQELGLVARFNKQYYTIHHVEHNSPAQQGGLRKHDIIRKVNNQPIETISHDTFLQVMKDSNDITLTVQSLDDYKRTHPEQFQNHSTQ